MTLPAQRSNVIFGEPGFKSADVIADSGDLTNGETLEMSANSDELGVDQILKLNDAFYDTWTEEIYAQQVSNGNVVIIGSTLGWVRKDEMFLEVEATFNTVASTAAITDVIRIIGPDYIAANNGNRPVSYWNLIQPEFCMLQPVVRIQCSLGDNNQIIQRQQMNYLPNLLQIASNNVYQGKDFVARANLGLPTSRLMKDIYQTGTPNTILSIYSNLSEINQDIIKQWNNIVTDLVTSTVAGGATVPYTVKLAIPLSMINTFWNDCSFLPPGLKFRFEVQYNTGNIEIMRVFQNLGTGASAIPANLSQAITVSWSTNMRLVYRRHQLRQALQLAVNQKWLTKPFLYNYDTFETVEVQFDGVQTTITKDIAISQQRPTQLTFKVMSTSPILLSSYGGNFIRGQTYPYGTIPVIFANVQVYIGGRQNYFLRTTLDPSSSQINSNMTIKDGTNLLNIINEGNTYLDNGDDIKFTTPKMFGGIVEGNRLVININPGDCEHRGYMSTDQGAVVIRVIMSVYLPTPNTILGTPLPSTCKLVIYKKLPEQQQIDASKNITTISWPAVASNNGYLISNTYNMN